MLHPRSRLALELAHASILWVPEVKPPEREGDRSSSSSAEVNVATCTATPSPPHMPSWRAKEHVCASLPCYN